jgi:CRP-like cAMP-binding protein
MSTPHRSLFLNSLAPLSRDWLVSRSTMVDLPIRTSLYVSEMRPDYAYFITSGIASIVSAMADGKAAEVGVIGREGIVGCFHLLGPALVPTDCFIQLTATALRIRLSDLRLAFRSSEEIRDRTLEFVQEQSLSLAQLAGCHRLHEQGERLARWLLMVQDRTQSDRLEITQEFLGQMLGAKRTTVTVVASALQRKGVIQYTRGHINIVDRAGLEAAACSCYPVLENLYSGLYDAPWLSTNHISQSWRNEQSVIAN